MLIPLFYYLSNPFLHRMTNFIPTAAPIFPSSCSFPEQPGRLSAHLHLPPPSCRFRTLPNARAGYGTSTLCPCPARDTAKSSRTARREPTWHHREGGPGCSFARKQILHFCHLIWFFVFLQLQGTSRDWRETNVFTSLCPQDAGQSLPAAGKQTLRSRDRLASRAEI